MPSKPLQSIHRRPTRRIQIARRRRAVATLETAVALPMIIFLTFASLEISNGIFLRQSLVTASYEGARAITKTGGSVVTANTRISEVLTARGVSRYVVEYIPNNATTLPRGSRVEVRLTSTEPVLSYAPFRLFSGRSITASTHHGKAVTMNPNRTNVKRLSPCKRRGAAFILIVSMLSIFVVLMAITIDYSNMQLIRSELRRQPTLQPKRVPKH